MKVRVLYHDHCFDGAASAAFFTRFTEEKFYRGAEFVYTGMAHKADQLFEDSLFDGDENAIVDFKYSPNPRLSWWFDHHQSAFLTQEDAEHFQRVKDGKRFYFDPHSRSCTIFIARIAREIYGYEAPDLADLVHWADVIDGAVYRSAEEAVSLRYPATQLTLIIEAVKGSGMVQRIIGEMQTKSLAEIMREPDIQAAYQPLYERHLRTIDIIRKEGRAGGSVIYFDVSAYDMDGYNKFVPYSLFPNATYSVSVSLQSFRTKVSVGSNPWAPEEPRHNLASICERYGGGGHPRVGAISFPLGQVETARKAAAEIVAELRT
ncbi:MAG: phosphoesterase [Bryobacterales bacterium]|nr:phosphoesterase [Bryobacterales bacterium]